MRTPSTIRDATPSDSAEIARLCTELGYPVSPADIQSRMSLFEKAGNRFVAVAAESGPKLLGWIAAEHRMLLESGERVEIVGLVVDERARRQGIGKALVATAESWATARGIQTVFVRSNVARSASHRFYEDTGYERAKTQHAYSKTL